MRFLVAAVTLFCLAGLAVPVLRHEGSGTAAPASPPPPSAVAPHLPKPAPVRPPQFVVVGFDGSGGRQMFQYWLAVGRRAHAHFTFFLSGVYLLDWNHHDRYDPPRHERGESSIGFAEETGDLTIANTVEGLRAGLRAGDEIGTHYNGHFCSPDPNGVGSWSAADWRHELAQFDSLLAGARLPFGPREVVGSRTPCLEGKPKTLYPVLARDGFRYDASQIALGGAWPRRALGIWSIPLLEIPMIGHTFRVISMDYNFFANQVDETPAQAERETYRSLWNAFRARYDGDRAPLTIGQHFETWKSWAYDHALARFLVRACGLPEVRCTGYRRLVSFLDSVPRARLHRYEAGRFPPMPPPRASLNRS